MAKNIRFLLDWYETWANDSADHSISICEIRVSIAFFMVMTTFLRSTFCWNLPHFSATETNRIEAKVDLRKVVVTIKKAIETRISQIDIE